MKLTTKLHVNFQALSSTGIVRRECREHGPRKLTGRKLGTSPPVDSEQDAKPTLYEDRLRNCKHYSSIASVFAILYRLLGSSERSGLGTSIPTRALVAPAKTSVGMAQYP
jgi:hypothetical protein